MPTDYIYTYKGRYANYNDRFKLAYTETLLTEGLTVYYKMDEGTGSTLTDDTNNNNDGTIYGATWGNDGTKDFLSFDGTDDYAEIPENFTLAGNDFSVSVWIKLQGPVDGSQYWVLTQGVEWGTSKYLHIGVQSTNKYILAFYADDMASTTDAYDDGNWHLLTATFDNSTLEGKIYIDGSLDNSGTFDAPLDSTGIYKIGRRGFDGSYSGYWNGGLDNLRIYDRVLTPTDIQEIYNNYLDTFSEVTSGLILYLDAGDETSYDPNTSGDTWYDMSGNNHDAYGDPDGSGGGYDNGNFPVWQPDDGGRFYFDGSKGLTILTDMGSPAELTADFWCYKSDGSDTNYIFDGRNDNGAYYLSNYSSNNFIIYNVLKANDPPTYDANSNWWERWIHVVMTSNSSTSALWINGEKIDDSRLIQSDPFPTALGQYFRIGNRYTSISRWNGYFSNIKFYNRVLSENEINQNFNALRTRYGL